MTGLGSLMWSNHASFTAAGKNIPAGLFLSQKILSITGITITGNGELEKGGLSATGNQNRCHQYG
jgi:hypothetical protein